MNSDLPRLADIDAIVFDVIGTLEDTVFAYTAIELALAAGIGDPNLFQSVGCSCSTAKCRTS
jgi:phosphoglycolate phosphatase-like HAD superfamily hydrolase